MQVEVPQRPKNVWFPNSKCALYACVHSLFYLSPTSPCISMRLSRKNLQNGPGYPRIPRCFLWCFVFARSQVNRYSFPLIPFQESISGGILRPDSFIPFIRTLQGMEEAEARVVRALQARLRGCPVRAGWAHGGRPVLQWVTYLPTAAWPHAAGRDPDLPLQAARFQGTGSRGCCRTPSVRPATQGHLLLWQLAGPTGARPVVGPQGIVAQPGSCPWWDWYSCSPVFFFIRPKLLY